MPPKEKPNYAGWVSAVVAVLFLLGGAFAFGASLVATDQVIKTKVEGLESRLDKTEKNQDEILRLLREISRK